MKYDQNNVWVYRWGFIYSVEGICDSLQLNYFSRVIALCFIYALARLIYISRTLLDVLSRALLDVLSLHTSNRSGRTDSELQNAVFVANTIHFKNLKSQCR